jgi:hypothetical protein
MTHDLISPHQVKVYDYVRDAKRWVSAADIELHTGVKARTARHHAVKLTELEVFEQANLFPGYRYRLSPYAEHRGKDHLQRLEKAREVFGSDA